MAFNLPGMQPASPMEPMAMPPAMGQMMPPAPLAAIAPLAPAVAPPVQINSTAILAEMRTFYNDKKQDRKPYEFDWFLNSAITRNGSSGRFNPTTANLEPAFSKKDDPPHRRRYRINRTRVKYLAKCSKYTNPKQRVVVTPPSEQREDILDARFTQQFLRYIHRKIALEAKYELVVKWAEITGKAFWATRWNPNVMAMFRDPVSGQIVEQEDGDVDVQVVDAFSILVDDLSIETLGRQPRVMRIMTERIADVTTRHPDLAGKLQGEAGVEDLFQFQRQIAKLGAKWSMGTTSLADSSGTAGDRNTKAKDYTVRKEMFWAPDEKYKKGRYAIAYGENLVHYAEELPYQFWKDAFRENPYPFIEFAADVAPGQFYPATMVENLRPVAEYLDDLKSRIIEHLAGNGMFGKLIIPRRAKVAERAWNSEPNEKIFYDYVPGMPAPHVAQPPALAPDAWRLLDSGLRDFDEVSNVSLATLGIGVDTESGYQANLMQDANDQIFGPDRKRMQRSLTEAYMKVRQIVAIGYVDARMISIGGRGTTAMQFEFSQANIDPYAEIEVHIGSALPESKADKLKALMDLKASGLFGPQESPRVRRAVLDEADLGGIENDVDPEFEHVDRARRENMMLARGEKIPPPLPWHNDIIHITFMEDLMNSTEWDAMQPEAKVNTIVHYLMHLRKHDPIKGLETARTFAGMSPEIAQLEQMFGEIILQSQMMPGPGAPQGAPPGQPPSPGAPPPGAPGAPPAQ